MKRYIAFSIDSCDIFCKRSQPENAGIDMICIDIIPISLLLLSWALSIERFYRSLRLCGSEVFFVSQMIGLIVRLKNKGYSPKILFKRITWLLTIEKFLFGISVFIVF